METDETQYKQRKQRVLIVLGIPQIAATLATLFLGQFETVTSLISILAAVGWAVGILLWVKIDSEERGLAPTGSPFNHLTYYSWASVYLFLACA